MPSALKKEFDFYLANQDEMVAKYDGRVIAIKDGTCLVSLIVTLLQSPKSRKPTPWAPSWFRGSGQGRRRIL